MQLRLGAVMVDAVSVWARRQRAGGAEDPGDHSEKTSQPQISEPSRVRWSRLGYSDAGGRLPDPRS